MDHKFSIADGDDEVYEKLYGLVIHLANINQDDEIVDMQFDELVSELLLELVKGARYYATYPIDQKLSLLKRMMDNRIGELRYRHYISSRKFGRLSLSLDYTMPETVDSDYGDEFGDTLPDPSSDSESIADSKDRVLRTRALLSTATARRVFDAVVYGNKRLSAVVMLSLMRASYVFKSSPSVTIKAWHVADALLMPLSDVQAAMAEIRAAYKTILEDV